MVGLLFLALGVGLEPRPGWALPVDLELVLAVDVSPSVDAYEAAQQRNGYLDALVHPAVIAEIQNGGHGRIAVTYVEWAGDRYQRIVVDWMVIEGEASAHAFVGKLAAAPISSAPWTSISGVIDFARRGFATNGFEGVRRVIDISGDGPNSAGRPVQQARDQAIADGITINGLPVFNARPNPDGSGVSVDIEGYYERNVIGGPSAFLMVADFSVFAPTILKKLIREIARREAPDGEPGKTPRRTAATRR